MSTTTGSGLAASSNLDAREVGLVRSRSEMPLAAVLEGVSTEADIVVEVVERWLVERREREEKEGKMVRVLEGRGREGRGEKDVVGRRGRDALETAI